MRTPRPSGAAIGCRIRPPVRRRVLRDHRRRASGPGHGDGSSLGVLPRDQPLCRRWTAARLLVPALQRRRGRRHCRDGDDGEGDEASLVGHGLPPLRAVRLAARFRVEGPEFRGNGVWRKRSLEARRQRRYRISKTEQRSQRRKRRRHPSPRRHRVVEARPSGPSGAGRKRPARAHRAKRGPDGPGTRASVNSVGFVAPF